VLGAWRDAGRRSASEHAAWGARAAALPATQRAEFERVMRGQLPAGLRQALLDFEREPREPLGGINISAEINARLTDLLPERMVLCADLEAPTAHKQRLQAFTAGHRAGAYVHCGVREHVMAAMANGIAAHGGVIPLAVTYLAFADYERPAMRMAALMGLPVKFVFSHDSIGIGKNGPTHQPVEILASLRALPNMLVMRPADAAEAAECWAIALEHKTGPVSLVFARQALPPVRHASGEENLSRRGAYVLAEAEGGPRRVTLLATGSEVALAMAAQKLLDERDLPVRVVSLPSSTVFDRQDKAWRAQVLGKGLPRIGVEAGVTRWWGQYGCSTALGIDTFGESAPGPEVFRHFGFSAEALAALVQRQLAAGA